MIDCPKILKKKPSRKDKVAKSQKGTSIDERPIEINNRTQFGNWEGDLVIGTNTKNSGALLTLVERVNRQGIVIKIKNKTSKAVYMGINKLERNLGSDNFKNIFKSITFDSGNEFARFEDIENHY